jgi:hypothetical protein
LTRAKNEGFDGVVLDLAKMEWSKNEVVENDDGKKFDKA